MYVVYKIYNIINDLYYIGVKKTPSDYKFLSSGYYGGGKNIRLYQLKILRKILNKEVNNKIFQKEIFNIFDRVITDYDSELCKHFVSNNNDEDIYIINCKLCSIFINRFKSREHNIGNMYRYIDSFIYLMNSFLSSCNRNMFKKKILRTYNNKYDAYKHENVLVNKKTLIHDTNILNIQVGGGKYFSSENIYKKRNIKKYKPKKKHKKRFLKKKPIKKETHKKKTSTKVLIRRNGNIINRSS